MIAKKMVKKPLENLARAIEVLVAGGKVCVEGSVFYYTLSNGKLYYTDSECEKDDIAAGGTADGSVLAERNEPLYEITYELDYSSIPKDTPVWVSNENKRTWVTRHFKRYVSGQSDPFICYQDGRSSHTIESDDRETGWENISLENPNVLL